MDNERRRNARKRGFFAVELNSESRHNRIGVSRDVSLKGMLIASPSRFDIGEELTLNVYYPDASTDSMRGRVLRIEEAPAGSNEPWRYRLAVLFEHDVPNLLVQTDAAFDSMRPFLATPG